MYAFGVCACVWRPFGKDLKTPKEARGQCMPDSHCLTNRAAKVISGRWTVHFRLRDFYPWFLQTWTLESLWQMPRKVPRRPLSNRYLSSFPRPAFCHHAANKIPCDWNFGNLWTYFWAGNFASMPVDLLKASLHFPALRRFVITSDEQVGM